MSLNGARKGTYVKITGKFGRGSQAASLGGEDLVEERFGLVLVGVLGECELADQDLSRLCQHALLTCGKTALAVSSPQVADDLGDLVDVAGSDLLDVGLVAPGPVGRFLGVGCLQDLEDTLQTVVANDVANSDVLSIVGRHTNRQIALSDLEDEVEPVLTLDGSSLDGFNECSPV